jgi:hypothetical protein
VLGVAEKIPWHGEEKKVGTHVFNGHPQGGTSNDDPGSDSSADQLVKNTKGKKIEAKYDERNNKVEDVKCGYIEAPGEGTQTEEATK